ncbi:MAG: zinc-binding dehydrogenase [Nitrospinota bacterium]|nr:zinc-binding dehydrogenase [Nitrospinota bacterium]
MLLKEKGKPFVFEDVPTPTPDVGEAVAKIIACGAGLTIHHTRMGRTPDVKYPLIIGHEITAEISSVGKGVENLKEGDAVTAYFYVTCGDCKWCRINRETLCSNFSGYVGRQIQGAYAEYMKLPAHCFLKLPEKLDYKKNPAEIAVICDAIATPYKVTRRARISPLENVAVIGAGGGLGIHMVMMAKWAGARVIAVDVAGEKLDKCKEVGADEVIDASKEDVTSSLTEITNGNGLDVAIDFVSTSQTIESASQSLGRGGRFVTLGGAGQDFSSSAREMVQKELEIMGSRYATKQEVIESLQLVARGDVWPLVTETYKLEDVEKAHDRLETGSILGRAVIMIN